MTARTSPSWYDVLGVDRGAGPAEIRTAWRDAIADLDPGDRRFRLLNDAAEVLLDPTRRSEYDQELPPEPEDAAEDTSAPVAEGSTAVAGKAAEGGPAVTARSGPPTWLLLALGVVTALAVAFAAYLLTQPADSRLASDTQDAQSAAERALPVIVSYDYRRMDADQKAADALMTPDYRAKYDALFAQIKANADQVKPVVTAQVLDSGIVRSGDGRVQVLIFVNRPVTRADGKTEVSHDQVRVTMVKSGGDWLVDDLQTSPTAS